MLSGEKQQYYRVWKKGKASTFKTNTRAKRIHRVWMWVCSLPFYEGSDTFIEGSSGNTVYYNKFWSKECKPWLQKQPWNTSPISACSPHPYPETCPALMAHGAPVASPGFYLQLMEGTKAGSHKGRGMWCNLSPPASLLFAFSLGDSSPPSSTSRAPYPWPVNFPTSNWGSWNPSFIVTAQAPIGNDC